MVALSTVMPPEVETTQKSNYLKFAAILKSLNGSIIPKNEIQKYLWNTSYSLDERLMGFFY